jgi:hypothetical protein
MVIRAPSPQIQSIVMASSSTITNPLLGHVVVEKLSKNNHLLWKAQVLPIIRGARLEGYLTGSTKMSNEFLLTHEGDKEVKTLNPAHENWVAMDQQVLNFLLSSMTRDVLQQVSTCKTAAAAWSTIECSFGSLTRARIVNTHLALATTQKGNMSMTEYVNTLCALGDKMASAGKPLDDEYMVSYILVGLNIEYNSVVSATVPRVELISVNELFGQLLSFESHQVLLQGSWIISLVNPPPSANAATRGHGGFSCGSSGGRGRSGGHVNNNAPRPNNSNNTRNTGKRPICQVCEKEGHTTIQCWYLYDKSYAPKKRMAAAATHSYGVDTNWYTDTGATYHITGELEKLDMRNKYHHADQVHTASSSSMNICHIGHSLTPTPTKDLVLKNIFHVPDGTKNLLSIHHFTTDNHASIESFLNYFLIKDLDTRRTLLRGWCRNGLHPLPSKFMRRYAFGVVRPSLNRWHLHLGHPSSSIVRKVVSTNNLPCL